MKDHICPKQLFYNEYLPDHLCRAKEVSTPMGFIPKLTLKFWAKAPYFLRLIPAINDRVSII